MESLGYILRRNIEALGDMGIEVKEIRSLGGGSKSPVWNQIKAENNQVTWETVKTKEAATLGAAILAGAAVGYFDSVQNAVENMVSVKERITPASENKEVYEKGYSMYKKLMNDLKDCFDET